MKSGLIAGALVAALALAAACERDLSALPAREGSPPVEWVIAEGLVPYEDAVAEMEARVAAIARGEAAERVWLVEHPPLYTAGTSARPASSSSAPTASACSATAGRRRAATP